MEELIAIGVKNQGMHRLLMVQQGYGNRIMRVTMNEISGAIQWVNHPLILDPADRRLQGLDQATLFSQYGVLGVGLLQSINNEVFGLAIDFGDVILGPFFVNIKALYS